MAEHIEGRPVSSHTYSKHGCRCPGCTEANKINGAKFRAKRRAEAAAKAAENAIRTRLNGQTMTRAEYMATDANRTRPETDARIRRRRHSPEDNLAW